MAIDCPQLHRLGWPNFHPGVKSNIVFAYKMQYYEVFLLGWGGR